MVQKRLVTKPQRNAFYESMQRAGLNLADFDWEERPSGGISLLTVSAIVHQSKEYYFVFDYSNNARTPYFVRMSPGRDYSPQDLYIRNTSEYFILFHKWLQQLRYDLNTADLWEELLQHKKLALVTDDIQNIPFTPEEQVHLATKLDELKLLITLSINKQQLSITQVQEQSQVIETQFEYFKSKLNFGRIDWKNLVIGGIISLLTGMSLLPECRPAILKALEYLIEYAVTGRITYLE